MQNIGTYQGPLWGPTNFEDICSGSHISSTGTIHYIIVNVDSGSGFNAWTSHCDSPGATYLGCTNFLQNDHRSGYQDLALPYIGSTTPTCTESCYDNVLFIPGMEASRLYMKEGSGENQLWEPLGFQQDAKKLYLNPDGTSINAVYTKANGAIDHVTAYGDVYKTFLEQLASLKHNGTYNDYAVFPYDWRMSPVDVVQKGTPYDDGIHYLEPLVVSLASSSKSGKVMIVAHSNGGLVTKALMSKLEADGKAISLIRSYSLTCRRRARPRPLGRSCMVIFKIFQKIGASSSRKQRRGA